MGGKVNKGEFVRRVAERLKIDRRTALEVVDGVFTEINQTLLNKETLSLTGWGVLEPYLVKERRAYDPQAKQMKDFPPKWRVRWRAGERLNDQLNGKPVRGDGPFGKAPKTTKDASK